MRRALDVLCVVVVVVSDDGCCCDLQALAEKADKNELRRMMSQLVAIRDEVNRGTFSIRL